MIKPPFEKILDLFTEYERWRNCNILKRFFSENPNLDTKLSKDSSIVLTLDRGSMFFIVAPAYDSVTPEGKKEITDVSLDITMSLLNGNIQDNVYYAKKEWLHRKSILYQGMMWPLSNNGFGFQKLVKRNFKKPERYQAVLDNLCEAESKLFDAISARNPDTKVTNEALKKIINEFEEAEIGYFFS